jgi:hypothetical protein
MRTKILILTAAIGLAGVIAMAQDVYSVNAVGYVNSDLKAGLNLVSNPLTNQEGNMLTDLFGDLEFGATIFRWAGEGFADASINFGEGTGYTPDFELLPGESVFVQITADTTVTFVGEVPQGQLTNPLPAGISFRSSIVPQDIDLDDPAIGFPAEFGDTVFTWNNANNGYNDASINFGPDAGGFSPDVIVPVGEGFVVQKENAADWTRQFSVNE